MLKNYNLIREISSKSPENQLKLFRSNNDFPVLTISKINENDDLEELSDQISMILQRIKSFFMPEIEINKPLPLILSETPPQNCEVFEGRGVEIKVLDQSFFCENCRFFTTNLNCKFCKKMTKLTQNHFLLQISLENEFKKRKNFVILKQISENFIFLKKYKIYFLKNNLIFFENSLFLPKISAPKKNDKKFLTEILSEILQNFGAEISLGKFLIILTFLISNFKMKQISIFSENFFDCKNFLLTIFKFFDFSIFFGENFIKNNFSGINFNFSSDFIFCSNLKNLKKLKKEIFDFYSIQKISCQFKIFPPKILFFSEKNQNLDFSLNFDEISIFETSPKNQKIAQNFLKRASFSIFPNLNEDFLIEFKKWEKSMKNDPRVNSEFFDGFWMLIYGICALIGENEVKMWIFETAQKIMISWLNGENIDF